MLGLALYESEICECGYHSSIAHDPAKWFTLEDQVCPLCADLVAQARIRADRDRKADEHLKEQPGARRPSDGRRTYTRPMTEDEVEAMRKRAAKPPA